MCPPSETDLRETYKGTLIADLIETVEQVEAEITHKVYRAIAPNALVCPYETVGCKDGSRCWECLNDYD